jgi:hypothetical protein
MKKSWLSRVGDVVPGLDSLASLQAFQESIIEQQFC